MLYEPDQKTVYAYFKHLSEPEILVQEAEALARLDIGVKRFIIMVPNVMDLVIECQPNQYTDKL